MHLSDARADRDDARRRDGCIGSVAVNGSGRATLVAMSQGDEFELQRGAAAHPERKQGTEGGQKREHADDGMTAAPETLHLQGFWSFE